MPSAPVRQNLYRKYRPQRFSELSGQEHISKTIQSAVASGRISHAYMLSGPRGTGKTSAARLLAKILNCQSPVKNSDGLPDCCRECSNCKRIEEMNYLDITEIDAASNNGVDDIRQMREKVKYRPAEGKYKIYIIDEVHMLSGSAFNAFLKTLEEPPENVVFVLATTDPQKVPATIISRCQCFDFHSVSRRTIFNRLEEIVKLEAAEGDFPQFENEALSMIAECAQGGFRDALSLLDQIASSVSDKIVKLDDVLKLTRRLSYSTLKEVAAGIFAHDLAALVKLLNELFSLGYEPQTIARDFLEYLRRCMMLKIDGNANQVLDLPVEQVDEMKKQIASVNVRYLIGSVTRVERAAIAIRNSLQARVLLESEMIRLGLGDEIFSSEALEKRVAELEQTVASLKKLALRPAAPSAAVRIPPVMPVPVPAPAPVTYPSSASSKRSQNSSYASDNIVQMPVKQNDPSMNFRSAVAKNSSICQALLANAKVEKPVNGCLNIVVGQAFAVGKLKEPKNTDILLTSAKELYGDEVTSVSVSLAGSDPASNAPAPKNNLKEEIAKIDEQVRQKMISEPSIADALSVFEGTIVNIEK